jgi:error-prone DNA polymerase
VVFSAGMLGCEGRLQREGEVIHVIAHRLVDLSAALRRVGERKAFPANHGRGDEIRTGGGFDPRGGTPSPGVTSRDSSIPDLHVGPGIRVKTRNFR